MAQCAGTGEHAMHAVRPELSLRAVELDSYTEAQTDTRILHGLQLAGRRARLGALLAGSAAGVEPYGFMSSLRGSQHAEEGEKVRCRIGLR